MRKTEAVLRLGLVLSASVMPVLADSITEPPAPAELSYTGPSGIRWTITADGVSAIHLGERQIARGGWQLEAGHHWYNAAEEDPAAAPVTRKEIESVSEHVAKVRHEQGKLIAVYTYTFTGEDVTIAAWVENHHERAPLEIVQFTGLTIDFGRPPDGAPQPFTSQYTRANPVNAWHPGIHRIGASWGIVEDFGVGVSPADALTQMTLVLWDWNWHQGPDNRENDRHRTLRYFIKATVPPGGARTFTLTLRVSSNTDWKHLAAPYKAMFDKTMSGQTVHAGADRRPLIVDVLNANVRNISEQNPYGFKNWRRIDTDAGVEDYVASMIALATNLNAQGIILWGQAGVEPRGAMYRPDFDVVPPEVERNLPKIAARFAAAGLKLGLTARPGHIAQRSDWISDLTSLLMPTENDLAILNRRFQRTLDWGMRLYYLDAFGSRIQDVAIMSSIRKVIGPDVQTYTEHGADLVLPWTGVYTSLGWNDAAQRYDFSFVGTKGVEFFQWLCPDVPILGRIHADPWTAPAAGVDLPTLFLLKHRITPLYGVHHLAHNPAEVARVQELVRRFIDDEGQWRNNP